jgi:hypothetical protein
LQSPAREVLVRCSFEGNLIHTAVRFKIGSGRGLGQVAQHTADHEESTAGKLSFSESCVCSNSCRDLLGFLPAAQMPGQLPPPQQSKHERLHVTSDHGGGEGVSRKNEICVHMTGEGGAGIWESEHPMFKESSPFQVMWTKVLLFLDPPLTGHASCTDHCPIR